MNKQKKGKSLSNWRLIKQALEESGPMSAREIAEETNINLRLVQGVLGYVRTETPNALYIIRWQHEQSPSRLNLNAVYALGSKPDAKRPKRMSSAQRSKRWRHKTKSQVASVFHLPTKMHRRVQTPEVHLG
jgi:hypothetical protein